MTHSKAPEQANHALMHNPGNSITIVCTRWHPIRSIPDPNRGLMRKLTDALLKFVGRDPYLDPFTRKRWD